jgi:hypothetical protein
MLHDEEEEETIIGQTIPIIASRTTSSEEEEEEDSHLYYFASSASHWVQKNLSYYLGDDYIQTPACFQDTFNSLCSYSYGWFSWFCRSIEEATTGSTTAADADATVRTDKAAMASDLLARFGQQQQQQQQQHDLGYWWQDLYTCAYIAIGLALFRIYMVHLLVPKSLVLRGGVKKRPQPLRAALLRSKSNNFFHLSNHTSSSHGTTDGTTSGTPNDGTSGNQEQTHVSSMKKKKSSPPVLITPLTQESTRHDKHTTEPSFTIGDEDNFPEDSDTDDYEERLRRISSSMPTTTTNHKHPEESQQHEGPQLKRSSSLVLLLDGLQE